MIFIQKNRNYVEPMGSTINCLLSANMCTLHFERKDTFAFRIKSPKKNMTKRTNRFCHTGAQFIHHSGV